jgi:hypothetical protein
MTMRPVDVRSQADIEERILRMSDTLEEQVELYAELITLRAEAEADYRYKQSRALLDQTGKTTVARSEAMAHLKASKEYREFRILEAREKATQAHMTALRSQLEALRTVAANVRASVR